VTEHDGTLYVLCFSDDGPDTGPHPISQEELRAAFSPSNGWNVAAIEPDGFRRDTTTTTAHRPGSRQSNGSRPRNAALCVRLRDERRLERFRITFVLGDLLDHLLGRADVAVM